MDQSTPEALNKLWEDFRRTHPHQSVTTEEVTWNYIRGGQGPDTLLLLPGGSGMGEGFFLHIPSFEQRFRVIVPVYPTLGSVEPLVRGLLAILQAEGAERVNVLGQSSGGMLAQVLVRKQPDLISSLILSHTTTTSPPVPQASADLRKASLNRFLRVLMGAPFWLTRWMLGRQLGKLKADLPAGEARFWRGYFRERLRSSDQAALTANYTTMVDFLDNYTFSDSDLAGWPGRVLLLDSGDDPSFSSEEKEALGRLYPQAQTHTFPGTGYLATIQYREEFLRVVLDFLRIPVEK